MIRTEACGCRSDGRQWLSYCSKHQQDYEATKARWTAEHIARNPNTRFTAEYRALAATHEPLPEFLK